MNIKLTKNNNIRVTFTQEQLVALMAVLSHVKLGNESVYEIAISKILCKLFDDPVIVSNELDHEAEMVSDSVTVWYDSDGEWDIRIKNGFPDSV
jgi:hypothetical protein